MTVNEITFWCVYAQVGQLFCIVYIDNLNSSCWISKDSKFYFIEMKLVYQFSSLNNQLVSKTWMRKKNLSHRIIWANHCIAQVQLMLVVTVGELYQNYCVLFKQNGISDPLHIKKRYILNKEIYETKYSRVD